ncbi:hypothetical protein G6F56_014480 [Rhizopus delemar]|nr:hypothetical protein G6F56_014480 [Rhizopus delemar]
MRTGAARRRGGLRHGHRPAGATGPRARHRAARPRSAAAGRCGRRFPPANAHPGTTASRALPRPAGGRSFPRARAGR